MIAVPSRDRNFMQWCWVVTDIDAAIRHWVRTAGVGPFFLFKGVKHDQAQYRGQPSETPHMTAAMAQAGSQQIELIEVHDNRPSIFRDVIPAGKSGLHHAALYSNQYDADVAAYTNAGAGVAFSGLMMGFRVCWVDTTATLGFMVEIIERNPVADTIFNTFRTAAEDWDGTDPIRSL
jgi:hypothetical protein